MKISQKLVAIALCACMYAPTQTYAYSERNILQKEFVADSLRAYLVPGQKWVKYPAYADRTGWDNLFGQNKEKVIKNGEKFLNYEWKVVKASDYLEYERSGNRKVMENPFDANNQAIVQLLFAELAEGKGRFMDQLINGVFHSCEMTSWALSAHLVRQPDGRSLPAYDYDMIDLTAGDLGNMLSWVYYFMHESFDKINPEISRRLYHELDKRIMVPYLEDDSFWWMAVNYKDGDMINNWNPWCNSNALMTFMLLENDTDRLAKAVMRSIESVDKFINYVHQDGACEEGPSYWGHASGKLLDYLVLLSDITGDRINVFDNPQIRNMGEYISRSYVGNGWVVNFADASAKGGGDPYLIFRYGKAIQSQELLAFAGYLNTGKGIGLKSRDVYRILEAFQVDRELQQMKDPRKSPDYTWYPETEFYYARKGKAFFAAKGGYNDESHNHNDAGTFSLWVNDTPMLIDAGVGTYTRQTFSSERYTIWTMQSNYHNLPLVNGVPQKYGRKYKAKVLDAANGRFSVDIAGAYPAEAKIKEWKRSYQVKGNRLAIRDQFELTEASQPNQVNFLTWGEVQLEEGQVTIQVNGQKAVLKFDGKAFEAKKESIALTDPRLSNVWGKEIYRISLTAKQVADKGDYRFTVSY